MKAYVLTAVAMALVTSEPLWAATLVGTQVTGVLDFVGFMLNYFDPANGRVPLGYLNVSGTTVTVSAGAVEFGCADGTTTITADFTGTQLTVTDLPQLSGTYNRIQMLFTNSAFTNLSAVSDTFPNGGLTGSLSGSVITLNWAGGDLTSGQTVRAVFNVNPPPSPRLSIQLTSTNTVLLSWPESATGFNLQQNPTVTSANWVNVTNTPALTNGRNQVIVSPPVGPQFYRLRFP